MSSLDRLTHLLHRASRLSHTASDIRHGRVRNIANRVLTKAAVKAVHKVTSKLP